MEYNNYEPEINLKDLMFAILHKWRIIIGIAVITALLMGSYKVGTGLVNQRNSEYVQEQQEQYQSDMETYTQTMERYNHTIESTTANLEYQENYLKDSVLMQISPYNKAAAHADLFIKLDGNEALSNNLVVDETDSIVKAYASLIKQDVYLEGIAKELGIEIKYVKELISVDTDYNSNMLTINTCYLDEVGAKKILDGILGNITKEQPEIQQKLGLHVINTLNESVSTLADLNLAKVQKDNMESVASMQKVLEETEKSLKDLKEPSVPAALSKMTIAKSAIKYSVLGGVLGAFVVIFCFCVVYLMSDKLNSVTDLKERYGLRILGVFNKERKKRLFVGIDNWLDKLEGNGSAASTEEVFELMAATVESCLGETKHIMITGAAETEKLEPVARKFAELMPGVKFEIGAYVKESPSSLKLFSECDGVIFVEQCGVSRYSKIQSELEIGQDMKKKVVGCVVYQG